LYELFIKLIVVCDIKNLVERMILDSDFSYPYIELLCKASK